MARNAWHVERWGFGLVNGVASVVDWLWRGCNLKGKALIILYYQFHSIPTNSSLMLWTNKRDMKKWKFITTCAFHLHRFASLIVAIQFFWLSPPPFSPNEISILWPFHPSAFVCPSKAARRLMQHQLGSNMQTGSVLISTLEVVLQTVHSCPYFELHKIVIRYCTEHYEHRFLLQVLELSWTNVGVCKSTISLLSASLTLPHSLKTCIQ